MAINISKYVNINSVQGAGTVVPQRDLVARLFTDNQLVPPQTFLSFTSAAAVGAYFGTSSQEYLRSVMYFGWVSKTGVSPNSIQFARWCDTVSVAGIFGITGENLASLNAVNAGGFTLTLTPPSGSPSVATISALNLSSAGSLSAVATAVESAIQGVGGSFSNALVSYNTPGNNFLLALPSFNTNYVISITDGAQDAATVLGWYPAQVINNQGVITQSGSILSNGSAIETVSQCLNTSYGNNNNFGSFTMMPLNAANFVLTCTLNDDTTVTTASTVGLLVGMAVSGTYIPANTVISSITNSTTFVLSNAATGSGSESVTFSQLPLLVAAASWNYSLTPNVNFMFSVPVAAASVTAYQAAMTGYGGTALTVSLFAGYYEEQMPMIIEAATNYNAPNGVQNYMYQIFPSVQPSVFDLATAQGYDSAKVNYYGQTQTAGVFLNFYQNAFLQGPATSPSDMNTYVNEIWLKDGILAAIMTTFLSLQEVPANATGSASLLGVIQNVINQALINGVISVGKPLIQAQQVYITSATNDPNAWYQVQTIGYWFSGVITYDPTNNQYSYTYTLVYSKNDVVRSVNGTDILI